MDQEAEKATASSLRLLRQGGRRQSQRHAWKPETRGCEVQSPCRSVLSMPETRGQSGGKARQDDALQRSVKSKMKRRTDRQTNRPR